MRQFPGLESHRAQRDRRMFAIARRIEFDRETLAFRVEDLGHSSAPFGFQRDAIHCDVGVRVISVGDR